MGIVPYTRPKNKTATITASGARLEADKIMAVSFLSDTAQYFLLACEQKSSFFLLYGVCS
ncbi:MAG: hypothetical protein RRZ69_07785 [Clostridia bacterium]